MPRCKKTKAKRQQQQKKKGQSYLPYALVALNKKIEQNYTVIIIIIIIFTWKLISIL